MTQNQNRVELRKPTVKVSDPCLKAYDKHKISQSNSKELKSASLTQATRQGLVSTEATSPEIRQKEKLTQQALRKLQKSKTYSEFYDFQSVLGEGAFCRVYKALDLATNELIAVKVIKRKNLEQKDVTLLKQEAVLLQHMDHKNIVHFKHIREIKGKIFLGMELARGGRLSTLIASRKQSQEGFTDEEASMIVKNILEAVVYLHSQDIFHRDLKPDNILLDDLTDLSSIKVADFGLSAKFEHWSFAEADKQVGTLIFMGPELLQKGRYSKGVDVFATGIVMYMLLTGGDHPLYDSKKFQTESYKKQLLSLTQFSFPNHLSALARNLFLRLTNFNISTRYSAEEAVKHPWITRLNRTLIPMTMQDEIDNMTIENNFRRKVGLMLFLSNVSRADQTFMNSQFVAYKQQVNRIAKKIEKWHQNDLKLQHFVKDEDFEELNHSPSQFNSSSSEEEIQAEIDQNLNAQCSKFDSTERIQEQDEPINFSSPLKDTKGKLANISRLVGTEPRKGRTLKVSQNESAQKSIEHNYITQEAFNKSYVDLDHIEIKGSDSLTQSQIQRKKAKKQIQKKSSFIGSNQSFYKAENNDRIDTKQDINFTQENIKIQNQFERTIQQNLKDHNSSPRRRNLKQKSQTTCLDSNFVGLQSSSKKRKSITTHDTLQQIQAKQVQILKRNDLIMAAETDMTNQKQQRNTFASQINEDHQSQNDQEPQPRSSVLDKINQSIQEDIEKGQFEFGLIRVESQVSQETVDLSLQKDRKGQDLERISKRVKKRKKNRGENAQKLSGQMNPNLQEQDPHSFEIDQGESNQQSSFMSQSHKAVDSRKNTNGPTYAERRPDFESNRVSIPLKQQSLHQNGDNKADKQFLLKKNFISKYQVQLSTCTQNHNQFQQFYSKQSPLKTITQQRETNTLNKFSGTQKVMQEDSVAENETNYKYISNQMSLDKKSEIVIQNFKLSSPGTNFSKKTAYEQKETQQNQLYVVSRQSQQHQEQFDNDNLIAKGTNISAHKTFENSRNLDLPSINNQSLKGQKQMQPNTKDSTVGDHLTAKDLLPNFSQEQQNLGRNGPQISNQETWKINQYLNQAHLYKKQPPADTTTSSLPLKSLTEERRRTFGKNQIKDLLENNNGAIKSISSHSLANNCKDDHLLSDKVAPRSINTVHASKVDIVTNSQNNQQMMMLTSQKMTPLTSNPVRFDLMQENTIISHQSRLEREKDPWADTNFPQFSTMPLKKNLQQNQQQIQPYQSNSVYLGNGARPANIEFKAAELISDKFVPENGKAARDSLTSSKMSKTKKIQMGAGPGLHKVGVGVRGILANNSEKVGRNAISLPAGPLRDQLRKTNIHHLNQNQNQNQTYKTTNMNHSAASHQVTPEQIYDLSLPHQSLQHNTILTSSTAQKQSNIQTHTMSQSRQNKFLTSLQHQQHLKKIQSPEQQQQIIPLVQATQIKNRAAVEIGGGPISSGSTNLKKDACNLKMQTYAKTGQNFNPTAYQNGPIYQVAHGKYASDKSGIHNLGGPVGISGVSISKSVAQRGYFEQASKTAENFRKSIEHKKGEKGQTSDNHSSFQANQQKATKNFECTQRRPVQKYPTNQWFYK